MFNATFSNISAISWRTVLVVEEAGVPGENHRPWTNDMFRQCGIFSFQFITQFFLKVSTHAPKENLI
jgi:hypothetical protein